MPPFELDIAIALTLGDPDFIAKNTRGNHIVMHLSNIDILSTP